MFLKKVKLELLTLNVCSVSMLCPILCNPWTVVHQAQTLSMGFPRPEYWKVLLFSSPGESSRTRTQPLSSAFQVDFSPLSHLSSPWYLVHHSFNPAKYFCLLYPRHSFRSSRYIPQQNVSRLNDRIFHEASARL